ncbi:hypothetical protein DICPUDRAFT_157803 [Dictyostelium purpureum]|uniref:HssA/2C/7E family protein n=1 Tax=Dictyostelium purpureum TaxID=5786 RepID=F1A017_DICPU|nr:uncharacterized protein DICPUDRAFT_157803 [Dictyostelium purpureum]EGC30456.1 hypothetical protein DICPUDRAFT_157803 [Dictyostelium purpureum]|eukprot:XP_003293011.1 hypothetical protein DICPUDRAFT_157803 [Dictyostelium purpureum]
MTLIGSVSSMSNLSFIYKTNSSSSFSISKSLQSSNKIQCGSGCGPIGIVPHLVGGVLLTTGDLVNTVGNTVGGLVNGLIGDGGNYGCN